VPFLLTEVILSFMRSICYLSVSLLFLTAIGTGCLLRLCRGKVGAKSKSFSKVPRGVADSSSERTSSSVDFITLI